MLGSGVSRAYVWTLIVLMNQYFDGTGKDRGIVNSWASSSSLGDACALIFTTFLMQRMDWSASLTINVLIFFLNGLLVTYVVDEP